jgi:hypothetical protein
VVLTLGSPPEKGGKKRKKKTLVLTLGSPPEKGREKNKIPGINPGQVRRLHSEPAGKGRKKKKKKKKDLVLSVRRGPETKIGTWTDGQIHCCNYIRDSHDTFMNMRWVPARYHTKQCR